MQKVRISEISVGERQRQDHGDIAALAKSIKRLGLIQPIVLADGNQLVAGERRLRACKQLGWEEIPAVFQKDLTEPEIAEMELEENVRRKDMDWKERVRAIARIHYLRQAAHLGTGDRWTYEMTGELVGISLASVGYTLQISRELAHADSVIHSCSSFSDAIKWLARKHEDEATAELSRRFQATASLGTKPALPVPTREDEPAPSKGTETIPLSRMLLLGDCLKLLDEMPPDSVDHCITDPPYAIDMDMLDQSGESLIDTARVATEHDVTENLDLLSKVIPKIVRVLRPHGYIAMWCDIMNWNYIHDLLLESDMRVQRWPIVWHKLHTCKNQCAQYNFTKDIELCIVARKRNATLVKPVQTCVIPASQDTNMTHPFSKPAQVWQFLMDAITKPGQIVLDPFCGAGSSLLAFISAWRVFVGIEVNPLHYNIALSLVKEKLDLLYRKPNYT